MTEFARHVLAVQIIPNINTVESLPELIKFVFDLGLAAVGIAIFIQFLRAGLTWLFAAGNASKTGKARELMTNAVLGFLLLISSYVLLGIINPDYVANSFDPLEIQNSLNQAQRFATNEVEHELNAMGIDWLSSDVREMSKTMRSQLRDMVAACGCTFNIRYIKSPGGEFIDVISPNSTTSKLADYVIANATKVTTEDIGGGATRTIWKDTSNPDLTYTVIVSCEITCDTRVLTMRLIDRTAGAPSTDTGDTAED